VTKSAAHEELIDDVRFALLAGLRDKYSDVTGPLGFAIIVEGLLFNEHFKIKSCGSVADLYIVPGDDAGPIMVEVGTMGGKKECAKWDHIFWEDGQPVRVLNVSYNRSAGLSRGRRTEFERDLMAALSVNL
jgi:hypothetical protein